MTSRTPTTPTTPCVGCPYRRDTQPGLWHRDHYQSVADAERSQIGAVFACHGHIKLPPAERGFCAGWLLDQKERDAPSILLRLALMKDDAAEAFERVTAGTLDVMSAAEMVRVNLRACDEIDAAVTARRRQRRGRGAKR